MKPLQVVQTTNEYTTTPVTRFTLSRLHIEELSADWERISRHRATRAAIKKVMLTKLRKPIVIRTMYANSWWHYEAYHSGQMAKIGCMIFRGAEYRKLRKWALNG